MFTEQKIFMYNFFTCFSILPQITLILGTEVTVSNIGGHLGGECETVFSPFHGGLTWTVTPEYLIMIYYTVRGALHVASETSPDRPASSADDTVPTTPQDRERAPALGHAALSIPHLLNVYISLFLVYSSLSSLTTTFPHPACPSRPLFYAKLP
jgi:hypothetical protein